MKNIIALIYGLTLICILSCQQAVEVKRVLVFSAENTGITQDLDFHSANFQVEKTSDSNFLREEHLQSFSVLVLANINVSDLDQNTKIAIERYLQAGANVLNIYPDFESEVEHKVAADIMRGTLKRDYQGENPSSLVQDLTFFKMVNEGYIDWPSGLDCGLRDTCCTPLLETNDPLVHVTGDPHLEAVGGDDPQVSWDTVTKLDLDDVTKDKLLSPYAQLLTSSHHNSILKTENMFFSTGNIKTG